MTGHEDYLFLVPPDRVAHLLMSFLLSFLAFRQLDLSLSLLMKRKAQSCQALLEDQE